MVKLSRKWIQWLDTTITAVESTIPCTITIIMVKETLNWINNDFYMDDFNYTNLGYVRAR